jgi:hypothetical protein
MRQMEIKAVSVVIKVYVEGKRGRGKSKNRKLDTIKYNMRVVGVCVGDVENRDQWRFRTNVADPKYVGESRGRRKKRLI